MQIKRYANRKLYDTVTRTYVTLDEIAQAVRRGEEVRVTDHATGEDLTTATLLQVVTEQERRMGGLLPQIILTRLIRARERSRQSLNDGFAAALDPDGFVNAEIRRRVESLVEAGSLARQEAARWLELLTPSSAAAPEQEPADPASIQALHEQLARLEAELAELQARR